MIADFKPWFKIKHKPAGLSLLKNALEEPMNRDK